MKSNYIVIFTGIIVFILLIICIKTSININKKDTFITANNDPALDGKMKYDYLTSKDYGKKILNKYYTNDDTVIGGVRVIYHPYQLKTSKLYGYAGTGSYNTILASIYQNSSNPALRDYSKALVESNREQSNYFYNTYGVRL